MKTFGVVGTTIKLRSGCYFDLVDPQPDQFTFADIAGGLSKICRFGGQVARFYSVAEHSYWCAKTARDAGLSSACQAAVLMHDASEAFIGDVVKPLKCLLNDYTPIEQRIQDVIAEKFSLDFDHADAQITRIDRAMLIAERRAMFDRDDVLWEGENEVERLRVAFRMWGPGEAEEMFVYVAREIGIRISV